MELRQDLKDTQDPEKKLEIRDFKRRDGKVIFFTDGTEKITPGPYKIEFRKEFLKKLLQAQEQVRKDGPDSTMSLILEEEIHEIQRIWRVEQGDWENSVYAIYQEITGVNLSLVKEDMGGFTEVEQNILDEICVQNSVPKLLVSKLLNAEFDSQGMTRHSKIYPKLGKILSEEWRGYDEIETIKKELKEKKIKKIQNEQFSRETK